MTVNRVTAKLVVTLTADGTVVGECDDVNVWLQVLDAINKSAAIPASDATVPPGDGAAACKG